MKRLGLLCVALVLGVIGFSGCSPSVPPPAHVHFEGVDQPKVTPWNGGQVSIHEGDKTRQISASGELVDIDSGLSLKGGMRVSAGLNPVTVHVGKRLVVQVPALATVFMSDDGEVDVDTLLPRGVLVTGATKLTLHIASSAIATNCDVVVGKAGATIHAKNCKSVKVEALASVTAVDCATVTGEDSSSINATRCDMVTGRHSCTVKAQDCGTVIGKDNARISAVRCKKVELLDNAHEMSIFGK